MPTSPTYVATGYPLSKPFVCDKSPSICWNVELLVVLICQVIYSLNDIYRRAQIDAN